MQVYKGVVPVDFGGDAIGGVINIVTDHSPRTYIDASYSYGSFNTHHSNLALGWTSRHGFMLRFNAYQNYSDNDYKVKTQWTDLSTSTISNDERWFRRFHDRYHNEAVILQAGLVNKSWANKLLFGLQYSHEYAQIQNANLMKIVFGGSTCARTGASHHLCSTRSVIFLPEDSTCGYLHAMTILQPTTSTHSAAPIAGQETGFQRLHKAKEPPRSQSSPARHSPLWQI